MTRRRIALLCLLAGVLLAALTPWTVRSDRVVMALARQIKQGYGISLTSNGRLTLSLLPMPQLALSGVRLATSDGLVEVEADELRTQLRLLPLVQRQLRLRKLTLAKSSIAVTLAEQPSPTIGGTLVRLRERIGSGNETGWVPRIDRFVLTEADIGFRTGTGREIARLKRVSLLLESPEPNGGIDLTASGEWNGETAVLSLSGLDLSAIRDARPHAVEGEVSGAVGRLSLDGRLTWSERPSFAGSLTGETPSIARLVRWTGLGADLSGIERNATIKAEGTIDLERVQYPKAVIEIGRDRLDGAVAAQFGERPQFRATMAAGDLDLGWLDRIVDPKGPDRLGADYDLRLSTSMLSVAGLRLRDAALSVQATGRGIELSLGRAGLAGGSLRGRLSSVLDGEGREIRAVGWIDGVDLERMLSDSGGPRGLSGTAAGQFNLDLTGDRGGTLVRQLRGRASLQLRDGELSSPLLGDAVKRAHSLPSDWRSGRVRFGQAGLTAEFGQGHADLPNGLIETPAARSQISGRIDLEALTAALKVTSVPLGPGTARPSQTFELKGPLLRLTLGEIEAPANAALPR